MATFDYDNRRYIDVNGDGKILIETVVLMGGDGALVSPSSPLPVKAMPGSVVSDVAARWSDDFGGNALDATKWDVEANTGSMTYSVGSSNLSVVMGTTANAELRLLSQQVFTIPFDITAIMLMSQRINNNSVYIEAIEVDDTGAPIVNANKAGDWRNRASILLDGTVATTGKLETVGEAASVALSQSGSSITTATAVALGLELRAFDIQMLSWAPDTAATRNPTIILNSSEVPDPNKNYKLRLRLVNGATPPATSTTVTIKRIYVQDVTEMSVEICSGRGDTNAARAIPANVTTLPALPTGANLIGDVGVRAISTTGGFASVSRLLSSAASTNATAVKATAGRLYKVKGFNAAAGIRYLKLYNKAAAPTVGTDTPVVTLALAPSQPFDLDLGAIGQYFATGIAYALTTGSSDIDTGALVAADIVGMNIWYA